MYVANSTGGLMLQTMLYLANQTSRAAVNTLVDLPPSTKSDVNDVKCYGVYGCFPINGPWTTVTRQVNVYPQKPSEIEPHFTLYTSRAFDNPKFLDLNDPEAVLNMGIHPKGKLYILGHGYLESGLIPWMVTLGKALLEHEPEGEAAVILIDWGGGSSPPYVQAVANIRLVGAITAHVVHMIYEELKMTDLSNVHFIGHSLGSHLAGYTGYHLQRDFGLKLGQISGLDPAAPLFTETDPIVRLDRSDADFVDIIHTDSMPLIKGGLGIYQRIGHVDFYPNGGAENPGCDIRIQDYMKSHKTTLLETMQMFLGCNHVRSYKYYIESVVGRCPFTGITCESYEKYQEGKCTRCDSNDHACMRMGFHSRQDYERLVKNGKVNVSQPPVLYLTTGSAKPFCRHQYKITVRVSGHDMSTTHGGEIGMLAVKLHGHHKKTTESMQFSEKPMFFEPNYEYTAVVAGKHLHDPKYATVQWEYQTNLLNPLTWRILSSPRIYLEYIVIESLEQPEMHLVLCPKHDNAVIAGHENVFRLCQSK